MRKTTYFYEEQENVHHFWIFKRNKKFLRSIEFFKSQKLLFNMLK